MAKKMLCVFLLGVSETGKLSSSSASSTFVDCRLAFSWVRCPLAVKIEEGIFLMMFCDMPGHVVKFPFLMAEIKVDLAGLKHAAWRNWASSIFV